MSKKSDEFYFKNFVECAQYSCEAALKLKMVLDEFNTETLPIKMQQLHAIENKGDDAKHAMMSELVKAFITPIERDDILKLSQTIDNVTDSVEDIMIHIYTNNVTSIRKEAYAFCDLLIKCCDTMKNLLEDFKNFRKSKKLDPLIVQLNELEENGDRMYIAAMKELHTTVKDPLEIIAWREIYNYFEKCFDACEQVADIVEGITVRNT